VKKVFVLIKGQEIECELVHIAPKSIVLRVNSEKKRAFWSARKGHYSLDNKYKVII